MSLSGSVREAMDRAWGYVDRWFSSSMERLGYWGCAACGFTISFAVLMVVRPTEWLTWLFASAVIGLSGVFGCVFLAVYGALWVVFHPKGVLGFLMKALSCLVLFCASAYVSYWISSAFVETLVNPDPHGWERAYVSESPNAKRYHYAEDCEYLMRTKWEISTMSVEEAENVYGLEACKRCLERSLEEKRYGVAAFVLFPVILSLYLLIFMAWKFFPGYHVRGHDLRAGMREPLWNLAQFVSCVLMFLSLIYPFLLLDYLIRIEWVMVKVLLFLPILVFAVRYTEKFANNFLDWVNLDLEMNGRKCVWKRK